MILDFYVDLFAKIEYLEISTEKANNNRISLKNICLIVRNIISLKSFHI